MGWCCPCYSVMEVPKPLTLVPFLRNILIRNITSTKKRYICINKSYTENDEEMQYPVLCAFRSD